jgi:mannose-1-phosphate guanylyltransferase
MTMAAVRSTVVKGVVLCAGLGTRLAPLTQHVPKPLAPIANRPALEWVLARLGAVGIEEVGINLHHLAGQMRAWVEQRPLGMGPARVDMRDEPVILDTGGGIAHFRPWAEAGATLLVHNCDVATDLPLAPLLAAHADSDAEATLALIDHPDYNLVSVESDGRVSDIRDRLGAASSAARRYTLSGVYVLSPKFLSRLEPGVVSSVLEALLAAINERPGSVRGWVPTPGPYWSDVGNIRSYLDLHRDMLVASRYAPPSFKRPLGGWLIDGSARVASDAVLEGFGAVGPGCVIAGGVRLKDCVVWSGTRLEAGFSARQAVISGELVVPNAG